MKEIQLTERQKECVEFSNERDLLVTGVAGSGKSLVLVRRAITTCRKAHEKGKQVKIGLFTYTNALTHYNDEIVKEVEPELSENIHVLTLDKTATQLFKKMFPNSGMISPLYDSSKPFKNILDTVVKRYFSGIGDDKLNKYLLMTKRDWLIQELCWIKQHMYTKVEEYQECVRKGRGREVLRRVHRPFIFEIYEKFYQELKRRHLWSIDMIYEDLYKYRSRIPEEDKYDMVLIDEAQDLSLSKMLFAKSLTNISITISADFAQKIYTTGFTWKELGIDIKGSASKKLKGTHRNTRQIAQLANNLLSKKTDKDDYEDGDITDIELPNVEGPKPKIIYCSSREQEKEEILTLIKTIQSNSPNATIGILLFQKKQLDDVEDNWLSGEVEYERSDLHILKPGVKLLTYHSAKGLEFDYVILPMVDKDYFPFYPQRLELTDDVMEDCDNKSRALLFVGMTRAKEQLYIYSSTGRGSQPSKFLEELDPELYDFVGKKPAKFSFNLF